MAQFPIVNINGRTSLLVHDARSGDAMNSVLDRLSQIRDVLEDAVQQAERIREEVG